MRYFLFILLLVIGLYAPSSESNTDFRSRTIYFLFVDRFANGDNNNDFGHNVTSTSTVKSKGDQGEWKKYWGGDIQGLIDKLDYLKNLGVGAIWVTPLVDNIDETGDEGAYHGYCGRDFYEVDEHFGDWSLVDKLNAEMEARDMKLILDFSLNHSNPNKSHEFGLLMKEGQRVTDYPSDEGVYYHRNGRIADCNDGSCNWEWDEDWHTRNKDLHGSADFNHGTTGNSIADDYLIDAALKWVEHGVDGFRIDAIKHIEPSFVNRFTDAIHAANPKVYIFGEWYGAGVGHEKSMAFLNERRGSELLDFKLRDHIEDVLAFNTDMSTLSRHVKSRVRVMNGNDDWQPIFLDNHDATRMSVYLQTSGQTNRGMGKGMSVSEMQAKMNLGAVLVMTLPGIPTIYYGTEQYISCLTANSEGLIGHDPFNREMMLSFSEDTEIFSIISKLSKLRKNSPAIQYGDYHEKWVNNDVLVYERVAKSEDTVLVAVNRGDTTTITVDGLSLSNGVYTNLVGTEVVSIKNGSARLLLEKNGLIVLHSQNRETEAYSGFNNYSNLHVSSPEWQDQIIYFILIDRFSDGDPSNNEQGAGEYNPNHPEYYSGGDLQGIINKLDYIEGLGATSIWITPPVANQWWDPWENICGFHGYWFENCKEIDKHYGSLETYQSLSRSLHNRGMFLIQDIVVNHTGNFFSYDNGYNADDPKENFMLNTQSLPVSAPTQAPFNQNNINNPEHEAAAIYHFTPKIEDYKNEFQQFNYAMSDLDDINTANPLVRTVLKDSYGFWIKEVGVDAFRVDTAKFVEHDFLNDFVHSKDAKAPGMLEVAAQTGRHNFLIFGEVVEDSEALKINGEEKLASFLGTAKKPELPSVLNFPLFSTTSRVFIEGRPTHHLSYRLEKTMDTSLYPNPYILPMFIDNHDVPRFRQKGSRYGMMQALMFMMTIPGIPVIYYGTAQEFTGQRISMFKGGFGSDGKDHFDETTEMYQYIKALCNLRTSNKLFTRGQPTILRDNQVGPGVFAYKMEHEGESALIVMNTADEDILLDNLDTLLPEGTLLKVNVSIQDESDIVIGQGGKITMILPARSGMILTPSNEKGSTTYSANMIALTTEIGNQVYRSDIKLAGTATAGKILKVVIDSYLERAFDVTPNSEGIWNLTIPITSFSLGVSEHFLSVLDPASETSSETYQFTTSRVENESEKIIISVTDPNGDDNGPNGLYTKPSDETFTSQMDIQNIKVAASESRIELTVTMGEITDIWKPTYGFDHVLFNVFLDIPSVISGVTTLPLLNANAPNGLDWDYQAVVDGWSIAFYKANGATENFRTNYSPAPTVRVNKNSKTVTFQFGAKTLGKPSSLDGTKIFLSTWDSDRSDLRHLRPEGGKWFFGGGDGSRDPLIFDQSDVITIKVKSK